MSQERSHQKKANLPSRMEDYLDRYSKEDLDKQNKEPANPSFLERIRQYTHPIDMSDEKMEKLKEEYFREKYGL